MKGIIRLYILGLLQRYGPQHGYHIKKLIAEQLADFTQIKLPTIYYHLDKMAAEGLLSASSKKDGARPEKTVYTITEKGVAVCREYLDEMLRFEYRPVFSSDGVFFFSEVDAFIKTGITGNNVLEIGPGPGYVGLEWLKKAPDATLTACEISPEMIAVAQKNACEYGFQAKVKYVEGNAMAMPFENASFDAVITNGSLHEWEEPIRVFGEIFRVLNRAEGTASLICGEMLTPLLSG